MSEKRILTTHVGSLPRPSDLVALLRQHDRGEATDSATFAQTLTKAVSDVVARQAAAGLDIVNDGEASKTSYSTYIAQRLSGFGAVESERTPPPTRREHKDFPEFFARAVSGSRSRQRLACIGDVETLKTNEAKRDISNLNAALTQQQGVQGFMTAASPGVIASFHPNLHYDSQRAYLEAIGKAMQPEYEAIAAAGLILQVDCPDLTHGGDAIASGHVSEREFLDSCEESVDVLNEALTNIPAERIRMHLCWGNYEGPHIYDLPLETLLPHVLRARPSMISFEGANPRHAHEWEVWTRVRLPDEKKLMPGVLDTATNYVEHPELIAQRLTYYAEAVGIERVIASSDCGFETFAGFGKVDAKVVYKKLEAMAEGARLASKKLRSKAA